MLDRAPRGEREVRVELGVEPVLLVVGHRQQAERPDELVEVAGGGGDREERAAGRRMRAISSPLRGANTLSTIVAISVTERERLPRIGAYGRGPLVRAGGAPEGGGGGVDVRCRARPEASRAPRAR